MAREGIEPNTDPRVSMSGFTLSADANGVLPRRGPWIECRHVPRAPTNPKVIPAYVILEETDDSATSEDEGFGELGGFLPHGLENIRLAAYEPSHEVVRQREGIFRGVREQIEARERARVRNRRRRTNRRNINRHHEEEEQPRATPPSSPDYASPDDRCDSHFARGGPSYQRGCNHDFDHGDDVYDLGRDDD